MSTKRYEKLYESIFHGGIYFDPLEDEPYEKICIMFSEDRDKNLAEFNEFFELKGEKYNSHIDITKDFIYEIHETFINKAIKYVQEYPARILENAMSAYLINNSCSEMAEFIRKVIEDGNNDGIKIYDLVKLTLNLPEEGKSYKWLAAKIYTLANRIQQVKTWGRWLHFTSYYLGFNSREQIKNAYEDALFLVKNRFGTDLSTSTIDKLKSIEELEPNVEWVMGYAFDSAVISREVFENIYSPWSRNSLSVEWLSSSPTLTDVYKRASETKEIPKSYIDLLTEYVLLTAEYYYYVKGRIARISAYAHDNFESFDEAAYDPAFIGITSMAFTEAYNGGKAKLNQMIKYACQISDSIKGNRIRFAKSIYDIGKKYPYIRDRATKLLEDVAGKDKLLSQKVTMIYKETVDIIESGYGEPLDPEIIAKLESIEE